MEQEACARFHCLETLFSMFIVQPRTPLSVKTLPPVKQTIRNALRNPQKARLSSP